jgi:hypothetical protein
MTADNPDLSKAVDDLLNLYTGLVTYHLQQPEDIAEITNRAEQLLALSMNHCRRYFDTVTFDVSTAVVSRTISQSTYVANLAKLGVKPYTIPLTQADLMCVHPGMIPILLMKVCANLHKMPIEFGRMGMWRSFVKEISTFDLMPSYTMLGYKPWA